MSVTFSVPNAPIKTIPCPYCAEAVKGGWDTDGMCDPWCEGTEEQTEAPEANFANGNARDILELLGLGSELWGQAPTATVRQGLLKARNGNRDHLTREPSRMEGGHAGTKVSHDETGMPRIQRMGATVIDGGNTDEQTVRRLDALEALCQWAQENGGSVICWG
jgi:hypothetical protein